MAQCYDNKSNQYIYCSSNVAGYVAGILIPIIVIGLIICISMYFRRRQIRARIGAQQNQVTPAIVTVYGNNDQPQPQHNYLHPPTYVTPTTITDDSYDKPPSYEQSIQQLSVSNNAPAILPVTLTSSETVTRPAPPPRD